jgi:hypothetical protein
LLNSSLQGLLWLPPCHMLSTHVSQIRPSLYIDCLTVCMCIFALVKWTLESHVSCACLVNNIRLWRTQRSLAGKIYCDRTCPLG